MIKKELINFLKEKSKFDKYDINRIANSILENEWDESRGKWELAGKYSKDRQPHIFKYKETKEDITTEVFYRILKNMYLIDNKCFHEANSKLQCEIIKRKNNTTYKFPE